MSINLWPTDFDVTARTPVADLREQAALLGERTKGLVRGDVQIKPTSRHIPGVDLSPGEGFFLDFRLVAPALDYTYNLFTVWQPLSKTYPIVLVAAPWPLQEESPATSSAPASIDISVFGKAFKVILNEDELRNVMQKAFGHEKVRAVIGNLIANSQALAS